MKEVITATVGAAGPRATSHRAVRPGWRTRWTPTPASPGDAGDCLRFASGRIVVGHYRHGEDKEDEQRG